MIKKSQALHVVMRVDPAVGNLRRRTLYKAMRDATITAALRERFRIVHISLQRNHVHLLAEAENAMALARGMQGFQISAARHINTALGVDKYRRRRGRVFTDRYHVEVITSPTRARRALSYWLELDGKAWMWPIRETYDPLMVRRPQSWLLREGWKLGGGPISARDVPSKRP